VPVLHLENDEELVSPLDGRSTAENPATRDRVTVGRALRASSDAADRAASDSVVAAHSTATHLRTLELSSAAGSVQVEDVVGRLERLLDGERGRTRFFTARRVTAEAPHDDGVGPALRQVAPVSPASARTPR
jgi:hypothetical protein